MRFVGVVKVKIGSICSELSKTTGLPVQRRWIRYTTLLEQKKKKLEHIHNIGIKLAESLMRYSEQRATHRISARL